MFELINLAIKYKNKGILVDLSLSISKTRIIGTVAPNSTGKTTFLKVIARLVSKKR